MFLQKCVKYLQGPKSAYLSAARLQSNAAAIDLEKLEKDSDELDVIDEDAKKRAEELEKKRNKSRLTEHHRNILHNKPPYTEPKYWTHGTLKYHRKLYGKYGEASGVNPALCFPTKEELEDRREYERVAYPYTIPEVVEASAKKRKEREERIRLRQEEIVKKVQKLDVWMKDLVTRAERKEAEARAIKEKKERLIEEVRRHFGYTVDPRDDKFKEMLERKEREEKKAAKEARRKMKEEKLMNKLLQGNEANLEEGAEKK